MSEEKLKSVDPATVELIEKAEKENISTAFSRADTIKPCPIGVEESCCKICAMGPCRMPRSKKGGEEKERVGVCGATIDTVVARNFARKSRQVPHHTRTTPGKWWRLFSRPPGVRLRVFPSKMR